MVLPRNPLLHALAVVAATLLTAGLYYRGFGLDPLWWMVWLAPLPILLIVPSLRGWQAFMVAWIARALGILNLWSYLRHGILIPLGLELAMLLVPSALFALAVLLYRVLLGKERPWLAAMAFPSTVVATEYLLSLSQGTFGNTGYTQLKNLPVLQLASLTGLWGIGFAVTLFASGVACLFYAPAKTRTRMGLALAALFVCVFSYGELRMVRTPEAPHVVKVGLLEAHAGDAMFPQDATSALDLLRSYAQQVPALAARGAEFVVLPEMTAVINDVVPSQPVSPEVDVLFEQTARNAHVQILVGILHVTDQGRYNEGRLYSASGAVEVVYRKHHLVPVLEGRTTPGKDIAVLPQPVGNVGVQICRDMDYPELARRYAHQDVGLILAPAWDQGIDALWHGHMSMMRAVEDGFTLVRDAKVGLMTAADDRGRILAEESNVDAKGFTTMFVTVPVRHDGTLYQRWGDWFAWVDLAALAALLMAAIRSRRQPASAGEVPDGTEMRASVAP